MGLFLNSVRKQKLLFPGSADISFLEWLGGHLSFVGVHSITFAYLGSDEFYGLMILHDSALGICSQKYLHVSTISGSDFRSPDVNGKPVTCTEHW